MTIEQNKRAAIQFMGFGDPNAPLWIIDCNPIVEWDHKKILSYKDITHTFANDLVQSGGFGNPNSLYKNILEKVFPDLNLQRRYFHTSIMPYGHRSYSQRLIESELFGYEKSDEPERIFEQIKNERFTAIETFFRSYNWKEKRMVFIGGIKEREIVPVLSDLFNELYDEYKLPFEHDEFVEEIIQDYSRLKFILPEVFEMDRSDGVLNKRIVARLKLETT